MSQTHSQRPDRSSSVEHEGVVPLLRRTAPMEQPETPPFPGFTGYSEPLQQAPAPQIAPPPAVQPARADRAFVGTLSAIAAVLASRLLLFVSVIGAFVLAVRADGNPGLYVMIAYSVLTVLPLVVLDVVTRQRGAR